MRRIQFYKVQKSPPCEAYLLNFHRKKLCKRTEVNSDPSHLWYSIFSVGGMQLPVSWSATVSTRTLAQKVVDFFETFRNSIYLLTILVIPGTIWSVKSKIKQPKFQFVELPILRLIKLKQKVACWKGKIMNNHKKIFS